MDNNIDKWGSLSMPERASLISLFTGSGVTNLDEMRALYNEYGNGGGIHIDPSKKGTFTSAAKRHDMGVQEFASRVLSNKDDYSTAMVRKANFARNAAKWHGDGGDLDDNDPKDPYNSRDGWFRYWYENRPYQIIDAINWQLDGTKSIEKAKKAIYDAINSYNETYIPTTINGKAYSGKMPSGVTNYWNRDNGLSRYVIGTSHYGYSDNPERDFVNNSYGLNDPEFRQIIYTQDPYNGILKRTLIHERSHAIPWFIKDRVRDKRLLNDGVDYDKYLDNINEIYSRLNEFRFKNNLDPRKTYTEDDIIKWRESGALKNFDLDRYDNDSVYNLINNVTSNNVADNLPKNANYAAYGDDLRDAVYVPTDFSAVVNPSGTPEYTAEIVGRPYISLDIDKYNRSQIKHMAQNAASGDEAAMYFNGDDRGTIMPSSDNKWRRRVFRRSFNRQLDRNKRYSDLNDAKKEALSRAKNGDATGMYDYVNLGREDVLRRDVLPFMGAALSPIAFAEAIPYALNAGVGNAVAKGMDLFKYTMPGTYLKAAGLSGLSSYADAAALAGFGAHAMNNVVDNPGVESVANLALALPFIPGGGRLEKVGKAVNSNSGLSKKLSTQERLAAKMSRMDKMKVGNAFEEYVANKVLGGNKLFKYIFPRTTSEAMYEKLDRMNEISRKYRPSSKDHRPSIGDTYTFESDAVTNSGNIGKRREIISDPSIDGKASVDRYVFNSDSYTVYHSPTAVSFSPKEYNVTKSLAGSKRNATSDIIGNVHDNTLSPAIRVRNAKINSQMGGDGIITGSPTLYESIPGIPKDTDIITTEKRANGVIRKLGLKETGRKNLLGDRKYSFTNNTDLYGTDPIDLDVIHEENGHAVGKLAEEIYAVVDPVGYSKLRNDNTVRSLTKQQPNAIPYSAEELYSMLQSNPDYVQELNMMNTFRSGHIKHNNRIAAFIAVDPAKSKRIIEKIGKSVFGDEYKSVGQLMPKMNYNDISENERFLKSLNMPEEWASDPEKVSAVLEKYVLEKTTATRGVSGARTWNEAIDYSVSPSAARSASGPGRNSVEGSKYGGGHSYAKTMMTALQFPISNKQVGFTSPMEVVNAIERQSTVSSGRKRVSELFTNEQINEINNILGEGNGVSPDMTYKEMVDRITFHQAKVGSFKNGTYDYSQQVVDNEKISGILDLPVIRTGYYYDITSDSVKQAGYVGGMTADHYGLAYAPSGQEIELGSMFPIIDSNTNIASVTRYGGTAKKIMQDTPDIDQGLVKRLIRQIDDRIKHASNLKLDSEELMTIKESADEGRSTKVFKKNLERQRQVRKIKNREAARRNEYHNTSQNGDDVMHVDYHGDILNTQNKYQAIADVYRKEFHSASDIKDVHHIVGLAASGVISTAGGLIYIASKTKDFQEKELGMSVRDYKKSLAKEGHLQRKLIDDIKNKNGIFKNIVVDSPEYAYTAIRAFLGEKFLKKNDITIESIREEYGNSE